MARAARTTIYSASVGEKARGPKGVHRTSQEILVAVDILGPPRKTAGYGCVLTCLNLYGDGDQQQRDAQFSDVLLFGRTLCTARLQINFENGANCVRCDVLVDARERVGLAGSIPVSGEIAFNHCTDVF